MNKNLCLVGLATLILTGCNTPFKKSADGTEYKLIVNKSGRKAVTGDFIQLNILNKYRDSVLFSTIENGSPRFIPFDTTQLPVFFKEIHEGDSLVIRMSTDTIIKKGQAEPFMKKGQFIYQCFKIAKLYSSKEAADSAAKSYEATAKAIGYKKAQEQIKKMLETSAPQLKKDDQVIADYLAKNNLKATKTAWGTYVAITTPGTGANLTDRDVAVVNYTGRNLKDSVFDSNVDPRFGHVAPYDVNLGEFGVILGWIDGLKTMQKGTIGKLIIPSSLAYGKEAKGANIGPDEILVFDIHVTDVIGKEQFEARQKAQQEEMMAKQQQMMEERNKQQEAAQKAAGVKKEDGSKK